MANLDWKNLTQRPDARDSRVRLVADPVEHEGVRNALRRSFEPIDAEMPMPEDMRQLLNKIH